MRALVAVGLVVALAGCASDGGTATGGSGRSPRASDRSDGAVLDAGATYVALGDSYTAAPMVGPTTDLADGCFRSRENYPALVAERLSLELRDVSCGGATTGDLVRPQETMIGGTVPSQLDAVSADTELVTVSLGGNDFGLFASLVRGCRWAGTPDRTGGTCAGSEGLDDAMEVQRTTERIGRRLRAGIEAVRERAPGARVVVVGYPQIAPARGACAELPVARSDAALARRVNVLLTEELEAAAADAGVDYVDVFAATEGHDLCSDEPWIADGSARPPEAAPYHPLAAEQQVVADLLVELLTDS
jgi:lysophospholipase L1-like esterase